MTHCDPFKLYDCTVNACLMFKRMYFACILSTCIIKTMLLYASVYGN